MKIRTPALLSRSRETRRFAAAGLVDKIPGQCWSQLVDWVLTEEPKEFPRLPWAPQSDVCRTDVARVGSCYCGKLRGEPDSNAPTPPGFGQWSGAA